MSKLFNPPILKTVEVCLGSSPAVLSDLVNWMMLKVLILTLFGYRTKDLKEFIKTLEVATIVTSILCAITGVRLLSFPRGRRPNPLQYLMLSSTRSTLWIFAARRAYFAAQYCPALLNVWLAVYSLCACLTLSLLCLYRDVTRSTVKGPTTDS